MEDCLFCKIARGEIPSEKVYEDDICCVFRDIDPRAKYHHLMIAKKHFAHLEDMTEEDCVLLGRMLRTIPKLAEVLHLGGGYRLVINQGDDAGQTVPHVHIHILSGQKMGWQPA